MNTREMDAKEIAGAWRKAVYWFVAEKAK